MSVPPKLAAVIGWPVHQSLSPQLHSYWLNHHGVAGAYVALPVKPEDFSRVAAALPLMGFAGANVTVPHKEAAYVLSTRLDEDARVTGAVNTLVFGAAGVEGRNTDAKGFLASLNETLGPESAKGDLAVVLGAGGAARAIVLALSRAGASRIRIVNRTGKRAEELASSLAATTPVEIGHWGDWARAFADAGLLVNTTSLGMTGKPPLDVALQSLPPKAAVADIVYNPLETAVLREARRRGHRTMDGLGMLMHQGAASFAAWFGVVPAVTPELRAELTKALARG